MFQTINGWTKETMKAQIRAKNNGSKSTDESGNTCQYRGEGGNCCALGCFIPDELYKTSMENINGLVLLQEQFTWLTDKMPLVVDGMWSLQRSHDGVLKVGGDMREYLCAWIEMNVEDGVSVCPLVNR